MAEGYSYAVAEIVVNLPLDHNFVSGVLSEALGAIPPWASWSSSASAVGFEEAAEQKTEA
jgi:hypothetical protein